MQESASGLSITIKKSVLSASGLFVYYQVIFLIQLRISPADDALLVAISFATFERFVNLLGITHCIDIELNF